MKKGPSNRKWMGWIRGEQDGVKGKNCRGPSDGCGEEGIDGCVWGEGIEGKERVTLSLARLARMPAVILGYILYHTCNMMTGPLPFCKSDSVRMPRGGRLLLPRVSRLVVSPGSPQ